MPLHPSSLRYLMCLNSPRALMTTTARWCKQCTRDKKTKVDIVKMNTALANIFLKAMSSQVRASFQHQQRGLRKPNIVFVDLFLWFVE
jgi:hypothetical protein